jgi:hypothetical protein
MCLYDGIADTIDYQNQTPTDNPPQDPQNQNNPPASDSDSVTQYINDAKALAKTYLNSFPSRDSPRPKTMSSTCDATPSS